MIKPIVEVIQTTIHVPGKPLGRHRLVNWHEIARRLTAKVPLDQLESVFWESTNDEPLNQENLGACTGFATEETACCAPFLHLGSNAEARDLYARATEIDPFQGSWPPDDTGSTGWAAMQAAVEHGLFDGFAMVSGVGREAPEDGGATAVVEALQTRPGTLGLAWYEGMDDPAEDGQIVPTGRIRGGHELCAPGCDLVVVKDRVWLRNSWGRWGVQRNGLWGYAWLSVEHLSLLLKSGGDATFPDVP